MRVAALVAALTVTAAALHAQDNKRPNAHQGFWIGLGLGAGSVAADCDSCSDEGEGSLSGYLRMGATLSQRFLLGGEVIGWAHSGTPVDETLGVASVIGMWYPSRTGAFYLKFGLGGLTYTADDGTDEFKATAPAVSLGLGYEWRLRAGMSVVPFLNAVASGPVTLEVNGQPTSTNQSIKLTMVQFGLGLTWH